MYIIMCTCTGENLYVLTAFFFPLSLHICYQNILIITVHGWVLYVHFVSFSFMCPLLRPLWPPLPCGKPCLFLEGYELEASFFCKAVTCVLNGTIAISFIQEMFCFIWLGWQLCGKEELPLLLLILSVCVLYVYLWHGLQCGCHCSW